MSPVDLTSLLDACQGEKVDDWCVLPHFGTQTDLLVGVVNPGSLDDPLITGTAPLYRALYVPDAHLTLAYGIAEDDDLPERREGPDWADENWRDIEPQLAYVLLDGATIWSVRYAYIKRGAGADAMLPWPQQQYEAALPPDRPVREGWDTTRWEVEFARLLNDLSPNCRDFDFDAGLRGFGLSIRDNDPISESKQR
jgi:hypothetical protein